VGHGYTIVFACLLRQQAPLGDPTDGGKRATAGIAVGAFSAVASAVNTPTSESWAGVMGRRGALIYRQRFSILTNTVRSKVERAREIGCWAGVPGA